MGLKFLVLGGKEKVPPYLSPGGIVQPIILDGDADPAVECRVETFDSVCCQEQHTLMVPSCSIGHTSVSTEHPKKKERDGGYSLEFPQEYTNHGISYNIVPSSLLQENLMCTNLRKCTCL